MTIFAPLLAALIATQAPVPSIGCSGCSDKVVFLGDSITDQGKYNSILELVWQNRHPNCGSTFVALGYPGYTVGGLLPRVPDLFLETPTIIVIEIGMNDGRYRNVPSDVTAYSTSLKTLVDKIKAGPDTIIGNADDFDLGRVVIVASPAVEPRRYPTQNGCDVTCYNGVLQNITSAALEVAILKGTAYIDIFTPTKAFYEALTAASTTWYGTGPSVDGVHPDFTGGLAMALPILQGFGGTSSISVAHFDTLGGGSFSCWNCIANNVVMTPNALDFDRLDSKLPTQIPSTITTLPTLVNARLAIPFLPAFQALNQYMIDVQNLEAGTYSITVDGLSVGATYTHTQLAAGVDLSGPTVLTGGPQITVLMNQQASVLARIGAASPTNPAGIVNRVAVQQWVRMNMFIGPPQFTTQELGAIQNEFNVLRGAVESTINDWKTAYQFRGVPTSHHWALRKL